jgi:hypothetical protein
MTVSISPVPFQYLPSVANTGQPAAGYKLFTYIAGTSTKQNTWVDSTQTTVNTNPILLDANGFISAASGDGIWLDPTLSYKFVLALPTDTDPPTSPLRTMDNVQGFFTLATLTAGLIGSILYPKTAAEIAAGVIPTNYAYAPGDIRRYGADPTGVADSSPALMSAIAANSDVFDTFEGGGNYLFNSSVIIKSVLRIRGVQKTLTGTTTRGTTFTLATVAGSNSALLHATAFISDFECEHITFAWQTYSSGQFALLFDLDVRSSRISNCAFLGTVNASNTLTAIKLTGGGTFSGDVTIEKNYISAVQTGVTFAGSCTTCRMLSNEMYCNVAIPTSIGVNNISTGGGGLVIAFNSFEAWNKAIYSTSGGIAQIKNYFESDITYDMDWGSSTNNSSFGDFTTGGPLSNFLYNNTSANTVMSAFGFYRDSDTLHAYRGFSELGLAANLGYYTDYTPTLGAGAGTLGSTTITYAYYSRKGGEMTVHFNFSGTLSGSATAVLTLTTPSGLFPVKNSQIPVSVTNGGANSFGLCYVQSSAALINIGLGAGGSGNFTSGTVGATGQITFRIVS